MGGRKILRKIPKRRSPRRFLQRQKSIEEDRPPKIRKSMSRKKVIQRLLSEIMGTDYPEALCQSVQKTDKLQCCEEKVSQVVVQEVESYQNRMIRIPATGATWYVRRLQNRAPVKVGTVCNTGKLLRWQLTSNNHVFGFRDGGSVYYVTCKGCGPLTLSGPEQLSTDLSYAPNERTLSVKWSNMRGGYVVQPLNNNSLYIGVCGGRLVAQRVSESCAQIWEL